MAVVVTALGAKASTVNATSITSDALLAAAPIGSLVVVGVSGAVNGTAFVVTDTKTNTWQNETAKLTDSTGDSIVAWSVITNALTTSDTITVASGVSGQYTLMITRYDSPLAGSTSANVADKQVAAISGTNSKFPSSGTTAAIAQVSELVVGYIMSTGTTITFTPGAAYTDDPNTPPVTTFQIAWGEYKEVADLGVQTAQGVMDFSSTWHAHCITFKGARIPSNPDYTRFPPRDLSIPDAPDFTELPPVPRV